MLVQRAIAAYQRDTAITVAGRIPALDGLRAFFVFSVMAYHFWQQSWLTPQITLFGKAFSLNPYLRTGYLWVDGMLLLSGFLLFLPHARRREAGRPFLPQQRFYLRRVARIVPSYVFNLLVVFLVVALPEKRYATAWAGIRDWLAHLTFTHPWFSFSSQQTPLNGALWTLGIEMQFYLLFPLLARAYTRMPLLTYLGALGLAWSFRGYAMAQPQSAMLVNQLPNFMDVYLNGFVAATIFARFEKQKDEAPQRLLMSAVMLAAIMGLAVLVRSQAAAASFEEVRYLQLRARFPQSVLSALLLLGACLGLGGIRLLLGNRLMAFLAGISYQVYVWHQVTAVQLRTWRIPFSQHQYPNMVGDRPWQVQYTVLVLALSLLLATGATYLVERPLARRILNSTRTGRRGKA